MPRMVVTTLWAAAVLVASPLALDAQQNNGLTGSGTATFTNPSWGILSCSGLQCDPLSGQRPRTTQGDASAFDDNKLTAPNDFGFATDDRQLSPGYGHATASATLVGPLARPVLKAYAEAFMGFGQPDEFSEPNFFFYRSTAIANAAMWYQNTSSERKDVSISFSLDAYLKSTLPESNNLVSVQGSVFAWDGIQQGGEGVLLGDGDIVSEGPPNVFGRAITGASLAFNANDADDGGLVEGTASFNFSLDAGAGFYLLSFLGVSVNGLDGDQLADAYNTMTVSFSDGSEFLSPEFPGVAEPSTTVPEPSTYLLMAAGLGGLVAMARLRRTPAR